MNELSTRATTNQRRQHHRRGFYAEDAWAEGDHLPAVLLRQGDLSLREAAFGTNRKGDRLRRGYMGQRLSAGIGEQPYLRQVASAGKVLEGLQRVNPHEHVPAALLAGFLHITFELLAA
jgi:hypothetical protein